jgi:hypothetical protein
MSIKFKPNVFFSKKTMKAIEPNFSLKVKMPKQVPSQEDADLINLVSNIACFILIGNICACLLIHFILPLTLCGKDENETEIADAYSRR